MTLASLRPKWLDEALRNLPAVVITSPDGTEAIVHHPSGEAHPLAQATRRRLAHRGVTVLERLSLDLAGGDNA